MEVDVLSRKGKGKGKSGKGKKGGKKGKESHSGKGYGETTTEHSRFEGECRNCGKYGNKAADCWYKEPPKTQGKGKGSGKSKKKGKECHTGKGYGESKVEHTRFDGKCRNCGKHGHKAAVCFYQQQHKPQGKGKGTGKSKSNVTEISESDTSKQVEETWPPNTSLHPSSVSQVNTIGEIGRTLTGDYGLWIFSVEHFQKRRCCVNWKVPTYNHESETCEQHELMIDSGCYGHVCPP